MNSFSNAGLEAPVALVIGGASGIGEACAAALREEKWVVAIGDISAGESGDYSEFLTGVDVTVSDSVAEAFKRVHGKFGRLNAVINTAGFTNQAPTPTVSDSDWDDLIGVHLGGSFRVAREAFPYLKESGGSILSFSSVAGGMGLPYRASYCAAKAGIEGLTRSLAAEWAEFGIRVNAIAPGWINTGLIDKDLASGLVSKEALASRISLRRFGTVEEVADLAAFLSSRRSSYITGQVITIDGGLSIDLDPGNRRAALAGSKK
jgi:NAD(P)-dependent dehydrogenase (short-subunit alcohol dehydrogenase family)